MNTYLYSTPEGFDDLLMSTDGKALIGLWFAGSRDENKHPLGVVETRHGSSLPPVIHDTYRWLDLYFTGHQPDFTPAYRMEDLTPFQIAKRLKINSAQAVGGAVGWNPICLILPCHRVMGANGNLTGYGGGMHNKIALLKLEGWWK